MGKTGYPKGNPNPTSEETAALEAYKKQFHKKHGFAGLDLPYGGTVGAVTIAGIIHVRDPIENSSTEGVIAGAVLGTYNLDRNSGAVDFYDPTGALLKLVLYFDADGRCFSMRLDTRNWNGQWNEGSWLVVICW